MFLCQNPEIIWDFDRWAKDCIATESRWMSMVQHMLKTVHHRLRHTFNNVLKCDLLHKLMHHSTDLATLSINSPHTPLRSLSKEFKKILRLRTEPINEIHLENPMSFSEPVKSILDEFSIEAFGRNLIRCRNFRPHHRLLPC